MFKFAEDIPVVVENGSHFWEALVAISTIALVVATGILIIVTMKVTQSEEHKHAERTKAEEDLHRLHLEAEENRHSERMAEIDKATEMATVKGVKELTEAIKEAHEFEDEAHKPV